jgi:hypothetical protein
MTRTKVNKAKMAKESKAASEEVELPDNEPNEASDGSDGDDEGETADADEGETADGGVDEVVTPMQVKVEPKVATKKPRRNLGGVYKTKNQVSFNGSYQAPGSVLTLSDEEARHFLKFGSVVSVEDE